MGNCHCKKCKLAADSHLLYCQKITHERMHCQFHNIKKDGTCSDCGVINPSLYSLCYHRFSRSLL